MNWFDLHTHGAVKAPLGIRNCFAHEPAMAEWHSVGLHPMYIAEDWPRALEIVSARASDQNCLAVGECGLDHRVEVPLELQRRVFEAHLDIAERVNKPVIVHCVRAFDTLLEVKKNIEPKVPLIIHGFSKHPNLAAQMTDAGFYLSFGSALLRNPDLVAAVSAGRFFLETDGQDISISSVYEAAAAAKGVTTEEILGQIAQNFEKVFNRKYPNTIH